MRLLHSADWQIGARFRQFGAQAPLLRAARLRTLRRVLEMAKAREVDALLIAGDLFEDHQIEAGTIAEVYELLATHAAVPIFILPGNHDPVGSPSAIWARRPFATPPAHVRIFLQPATVELAGGWLLANPLTQKQSTLDPTRKLEELARTLPSGTVKVGMTHGSPAIPSQHQPDDFPIALEAATRAGLDFLALGHWHSPLTLDGGRLHMPGTPEPTSFEEQGSGCVHEVEIAAAGALPRVTRLPCGELQWRHFTWEIGGLEETRARMEAALLPCDAEAGTTIARVTLRGLVAPPLLEEHRLWLRTRMGSYAVCEVRDETVPDFTSEELAELQREHPMLTLVLEDLQGLLNPGASTEPAASRAEWAALEATVGCLPGELAEPLITAARRMLMRDLREVHTGC